MWKWFESVGRLVCGSWKGHSAVKQDLLLIAKLQETPERYAFYVDVGDMPPQEALSYIQKVRDQYRRKRLTREDD